MPLKLFFNVNQLIVFARRQLVWKCHDIQHTISSILKSSGCVYEGYMTLLGNLLKQVFHYYYYLYLFLFMIVKIKSYVTTNDWVEAIHGMCLKYSRS